MKTKRQVKVPILTRRDEPLNQDAIRSRLVEMMSLSTAEVFMEALTRAMDFQAGVSQGKRGMMFRSVVDAVMSARKNYQ